MIINICYLQRNENFTPYTIKTHKYPINLILFEIVNEVDVSLYLDSYDLIYESFPDCFRAQTR